MLFSIRPANPNDISRIHDIYNHQILTGLALWNEQVFNLDHYQNWYLQLEQHAYPLFVIEEDATQILAGFAEYSAFRHFSGYRQTVEHAVYISPEFSQQGLGKRLMQHLIEHAEKHQVKTMVAAIDHENTASINLHEKLGFKQTGYLPQVGQKFGQWRDLVLMQLNFKTTQPNSR